MVLQQAKPMIDMSICACLVASYFLAHNLANWNLKKNQIKNKLLDGHDSKVNLLKTNMRVEIVSVARFPNLPVRKIKKTKGRNF